MMQRDEVQATPCLTQRVSPYNILAASVSSDPYRITYCLRRTSNSLTITPEPGKRQIISRKPKKRPGGGSKPNRSPLHRRVPKIVYNTLLIYL
jgi:hypothetical protein